MSIKFSVSLCYVSTFKFKFKLKFVYCHSFIQKYNMRKKSLSGVHRASVDTCIIARCYCPGYESYIGSVNAYYDTVLGPDKN